MTPPWKGCVCKLKGILSEQVNRETIRLRQSAGPHPVLSWKGKDFQVELPGVPSALRHRTVS